MTLVQHAAEGLRNLFYAKLRSLLALLGVLVGTASVVAMVLGGELATNEALLQFKSLGTDLLAASINTNRDEQQKSAGKIDKLTLQQIENILQTDAGIRKLAPYTQTYNPVYFGGKQINAIVLGVTGTFADIVHIDMQEGRFISLVDQYEFYCVIGQEIYKTIRQYTFQDPIGQRVQIGKNLFVIVGVAKPWPENSFVYANIDNSVLIPINASFLLSKYSTINNIILRLAPNADIGKVEANINHYFKSIAPDKQINFRSAAELVAKMKKQSGILTVFLGLIGSVSLLVGGIGVMNIMLVSVMERKREIGIRMAVGARRIDIGLLFLIEAIMLSLVGGVLGVVIGIGIAFLITWIWHWQFTLFFLPPLAGFSVSVAVGIFFGFYPALRASRLNPIDALRSD